MNKNILNKPFTRYFLLSVEFIILVEYSWFYLHMNILTGIGIFYVEILKDLSLNKNNQRNHKQYFLFFLSFIKSYFQFKLFFCRNWFFPQIFGLVAKIGLLEKTTTKKQKQKKTRLNIRGPKLHQTR